MHQLKYLYNSRICVFVFSIFPSFPLIYRQCLYVQYSYFAPTVQVLVFAHTRTDTVYLYRTYSYNDSIFGQTVSVSLLLHCNRSVQSVHNFDLGLI